MFNFLHAGANQTAAPGTCTGGAACAGWTTPFNGGGCLINAFNDFTYPGTLTTGVKPTFMHLKEGIERFLITDINNPAGAATAQSSVAVMWDTIRLSGNGIAPIATNDFSHVPGGANILFMDGHVEFSKYPAADGSKGYPTSGALLKSGFQYAG